MKIEERKELIRFIVVILAIVLIIVGVFFVTNKFVTKESEPKEEEVITGQINYDVAVVGTMLTKPESTYYIFAYDFESKNKEMYEVTNAITEYENPKDEDFEPKKIYNVDLTNHLNTDYKVGKDEKVNTKAKNIEDLKMGDYTILKVQKGKITKYLNTVKSIKKEWKVD